MHRDDRDGQLKYGGPTRAIPVIVVSNLSQETDMKQAEELGAVGYFVKANLSPDELSKRVEQFVERGRDS